MRRALPAAGTFLLTLALLDPIRLPELAAGLAAAAGSAAVVLLLTVVASRGACRRHSREALPPAAGYTYLPPAARPPAARGWYSQPPTQPMDFYHQPAQYVGPDFPSPAVHPDWDAIVPEPGYRDGRLDGYESLPVDWDALHLGVAFQWDAIMRHPDESWGTADMAEFEEKWKLP